MRVSWALQIRDSLGSLCCLYTERWKEKKVLDLHMRTKEHRTKVYHLMSHSNKTIYRVLIKLPMLHVFNRIRWLKDTCSADGVATNDGQ